MMTAGNARITKITGTSFMLDNYLVDVVAIKMFVRSNIANPHNQAHVVGLLDNIMILLTRTYKDKEIPDKTIQCTYRILDRLKKKHGYDWQDLHETGDVV